MNDRQAFTRESAGTRREALVTACAHCLAKFGASGTSVRAICTEAGVSPGLLRHYYQGIDDLIAATYRSTGSRVADALNAAVDAISVNDPRGRLLAYVCGSFREPVADPELLSTWLAFWSLARTNTTIARIHDEIYAGNCQDMERLIAACRGAPADPRLTAIALTALVDGLWLELSLGNAPFSAEEAEGLAEQWVARMLGPCEAGWEQQQH